ncbi:MAG: hypothetical protein ACRCZI_06195 [Cetobacterium sp.]
MQRIMKHIFSQLSNIIMLASLAIFMGTFVHFCYIFCNTQNYQRYFNQNFAKAIGNTYSDSRNKDNENYIKELDDTKGLPFNMLIDSTLLKNAYFIYISSNKNITPANEKSIIAKMMTAAIIKPAFVRTNAKLFQILSRYIITFICALACVVFIGAVKNIKEYNEKDSMYGLYFATGSIFVWAVSGLLRLVFVDDTVLQIINILTSTLNNLFVAFLIPSITLDKNKHMLGSFVIDTESIKKNWFQSQRYYYIVFLATIIVAFMPLLGLKNLSNIADLMFSIVIDLFLGIYLIFVFKEREMELFMGLSIFTIIIMTATQILAVPLFSNALSPYFTNNALLYSKTLLSVLFVFSLIIVLFALLISYGLHNEKKQRKIAEEQGEIAEEQRQIAEEQRHKTEINKVYTEYLSSDIQHRMKGLFNMLLAQINAKAKEYSDNIFAKSIAQELINEIEIRKKIHQVITGDDLLAHTEKNKVRDLAITLNDVVEFHKAFDIEIYKNINLKDSELQEIHYQIVQTLAVLINELLNNARKYGDGKVSIYIGIKQYPENKILANGFVLEINKAYLYISVENPMKILQNDEATVAPKGQIINKRVVTGLLGTIIIPDIHSVVGIYNIEVYIPISQIKRKQ